MSWSGKAWIVATSVGAVEVLKDQGICRWNHVLRSLHQHAKNNIHRSLSHQANNKQDFSSSASASASSVVKATETETETEQQQLHVRADGGEKKKLRKTEESIEKVMHLSCFGPNRL